WKGVAEHLSRREGAEPAVRSEFTHVVSPGEEETSVVTLSPLWNEPASASSQENEQTHSGFGDLDFPAPPQPALFESGALASIYFSGDTGFFSFSPVLRVIGHEQLTGPLRSAWTRQHVDPHDRDV